MSVTRPVRVIVEHGTVRMVHSDGLVRHVQELGAGKTTVKRASHVEWDDDAQCWYADMSPVNGPKLSGFVSRESALEAEQEWLFDNGY